MTEGSKRLELTMKMTDKIVRLSTVMSAYSDNGPGETVRLFHEWVDETKQLLNSDFDHQKAVTFENLEKPTMNRLTADDLNRASKTHAEYLQDLIIELKNK